jgi:hypothetical protein
MSQTFFWETHQCPVMDHVIAMPQNMIAMDFSYQFAPENDFNSYHHHCDHQELHFHVII